MYKGYSNPPPWGSKENYETDAQIMTQQAGIRSERA